MPEVASLPGNLTVSGCAVPAVRVRVGHGVGDERRGGGVVLESERLRGRVAGLVGTGALDAGGAAVGSAVGLVGGAGVDAGGRVGAREADRERVVVPTVHVGPSRRLRDERRRGGVVFERVGLGAARVAGVVGAGAGNRGAGCVPAAVGRVGRAGVDAGGGVVTGELDRHRRAVPAVRVRIGHRVGDERRRGSVVLDRVGLGPARVTGVVGARARDRSTGCVPAVVELVGRAGVDAGGGVGAGKFDRQRLAVPAQGIRVGLRVGGERRGGLVELDRDAFVCFFQSVVVPGCAGDLLSGRISGECLRLAALRPGLAGDGPFDGDIADVPAVRTECSRERELNVQRSREG